MTVGECIVQATQKLTDSGIITARLDCLILLEDLLGKERSRLLAHPEQELTGEQFELLDAQIVRRCTHEPLAYIRGKAMFYGREFTVNPHVLVPRPETEGMIDMLKTLVPPIGTRIADIGTGSGCLGITLALEFPGSKVDLYDIDPQTLKIARNNARLLGATTACHKGDLLHDLQGPYQIVVANLPYVPDNFPINEAARFEPNLALFAGPDGLDLYRTFWQQVEKLSEQPQYILTEALPFQHHALATLARNHDYVLERVEGLVQLFTK